MQRGSLKVVKDRHGVKVWRLQWRESGRGRTRILGRCADMTQAAADTERRKILQPVNAATEATEQTPVNVRRFVEDEYLPTRVWKLSTEGTTRQIIRDHILVDIGGKAIASISRKLLQAHLNKKADAGLSESLVDHIRWQLVAIFRMAKNDGLTVNDPAAALVAPRCVAGPKKLTITVDDIIRGQLVLDIRERLIFRLAVCEGMRPGEIMGLQIGDYRDGEIHIARRVYRGVVDTPKSAKSTRAIPPTEPTRLLLDRWLDLLQGKPSDSWIFASEHGATPLSYSNVFRRKIQPALRKIGLTTANFQILRRTWVTEFSKVEPDAAIRADVAGHGVGVHQNVYRQRQSDAAKAAMRRLGDVLQ